MSDERLQQLGIPRRGFLKRAGTVAFVAPVVASFGLDGIAEAGSSAPTLFNPNQCFPNQACPHYSKTITGRHLGALTIKKGQSVLLSKATVLGPVAVQAGGGLGVEKSTINGALTARGATSIVIHNSAIHGHLTITGTTGLVSIGGSDACATGNNDVFGPVTINGNHGGTYVQDNIFNGSTTMTGNKMPVGDTGNTIYGSQNLQSPTC